MKITKIWAVTFSPTGNSRTVVDAIVSGMPGIPCENIDLTNTETTPAIQFSPEDLVVIGVPVYAGRVAPLAVTRFGGLRGADTPAIIAVTYGNREFEDSLLELKDITEKASFRPVAACAFIGEHSFSGAATPIAAGRPDSVDLSTAAAFGRKISQKLAAATVRQIAHCPELPGNRPYKEGMKPLPFAPVVIEAQCTQCGACIACCPTGAISLAAKVEMDQTLCIFCCACIKACPEQAITIEAEPIKQKTQWLYEHCRERKEPELFLED